MNTISINQQEPICALATASGVGAIAVIRVSGEGTLALTNGIFKGRDLTQADSHTVHFGTIRDQGTLIDEVLVTVFRSPRSFTREDSVEISCHGSDYIVRQILKILIKGGARIARPGEFTQRAFLNGQFDLVQAEAVADLIAADSEASHRTALTQLRGGFSRKLQALREELIHFASLVELELDFGEEDVEFAQRDDLRQLIHNLQATIHPLIESFDYGNALKDGVPVAIIGSPNVGKSTLLNALLNEEKAIVTEIAGTTRDVIEDMLVLEGLKFRFIDTAGIRETQDLVESIGIERSRRAMEQADVVLMLFDSEETLREVELLARELPEGKKIIWVRNKVDLSPSPSPARRGEHVLPLSLQERGPGGEVDREVEQTFQSLTQKIPDPVLENARMLRQTETKAEEFLWQLLRNKQLNGLKFRRQHPVVEGFVLDFFCAEYRLGIELDGGIHEEKEQKLYDNSRSEELKDRYDIDLIRFDNREVLNNTEQVLRLILKTVESLSHKRRPHKNTPKQSQSEDPSKYPYSLKNEVPSTSPLSSKERGLGGEVKISARSQTGLEELKKIIVAQVQNQAGTDTVVTNLRHYEHLVKTSAALDEVLEGLDAGITGDFLAQDIRLALYHLGEITGTIVSDDLLANIFSKFCIGK
jgi:tRNA modification GTPase